MSNTKKVEKTMPTLEPLPLLRPMVRLYKRTGTPENGEHWLMIALELYSHQQLINTGWIGSPDQGYYRIDIESNESETKETWCQMITSDSFNGKEGGEFSVKVYETGIMGNTDKHTTVVAYKHAAEEPDLGDPGNDSENN